MRARILGSLLLTAFLGAGCGGDLFEVEDVGSLTIDQLNDPDLLDALVNSGEGAVCDAWDNIVAANALMSDDVTFVGSFTFTEKHMWGHMEGFNTVQDAAWINLSSATWIVDEMTRRLEEALPSPDSDQRIANNVFWAAFARVGLADHFREVPFDKGAAQSPEAVLEGTLAMLDRAAQIAGTSGQGNLRAAALATKARVYRSLYFERGMQMSDFSAAKQAAEAALAEKSDFHLACRYATPGSENTLNQYHRTLTGSILDPRNAVLTDPVSGLKEPRIPVGDAESDAPPPHTLPMHRWFKYPGFDADLPASRWAEARLILAEGHLLDGNLTEAVSQINLVRAAAGLPDFSSNIESEIFDQLLYERKVEFLAEGRRLQDHRYYDIAPWQWDGATKQLGTDRRWPISQAEIDGNTNYRGVG